jgi:hypothetical protein
MQGSCRDVCMVPAHADRCGKYGHVTKDGRPCGYVVGKGATACPHHSGDPDRVKAFQRRGGETSQEKRLPRAIGIVASVQTARGLQETYESVIQEVCTAKKPDLKRMDVILKALSGANAVLQTEAVKELNETVLKAEGHGPALVILEGLKAGRTRRLPGVVERSIRSEPVQDAESA